MKLKIRIIKKNNVYYTQVRKFFIWFNLSASNKDENYFLMTIGHKGEFAHFIEAKEFLVRYIKMNALKNI